MTGRTAGLAVLLGLVAIRVATAQGVEEVLARLGSSSWNEREAASRDLVEGWQEWEEGALERVESVARGGDPERAARAAAALRVVRMRRALGAPLVERGFDRILLEGEAEARRGVFEDAWESCARGELETDDLRRLAEAGRGLEWPATAAAELAGFVAERRIAPYVPLVESWLARQESIVLERVLPALRPFAPAGSTTRVIDLLASESAEVRRQAVAFLGENGEPGLSDRLVPLLAREEAVARRAAIAAIAAIQAREAAPEVARLAADPDVAVRLGVVEALLSLRARSESAALASLLGDPERVVVRNALEALRRLGAVGHAGSVARLLDATDAEIRKRALEVLLDLEMPSSEASVASRLADVDRDVRVAALRGLARWRSRGFTDRIAGCLEDPEPAVRREALVALARLEGREHVAEIAARIDDPDESVRHEAVRAVAGLGAEEHAPAIVRLLERPRDRGVATSALERLRGAELTRELGTLLGHGDAAVRAAAVKTVAAVEDVERIVLVTGLLADDSEEVRAAAILAFGAIAPLDSSTAGLLPALSDAGVEVRRAALESASTLLDREDRAAAAALRAGDRPAPRDVRDFLTGRPDDLERRIADVDPEVRCVAIRLAARLEMKALAGPIAARLGDEGPGVKWAAMDALDALGAREQSTLLLSVLPGAGHDAGLRIARLLQDLGRRPGAEEIALLSDPRPSARWAGIEVFRALGSSDAVGRIAPLVEDPEPEVRAAAVDALGWLGAFSEVERVAARLEDPHAGVVRVAITALVELGRSEEAERVLRTLERRDDGVRRAALGALADWGDDRGIDAALGYFGSSVSREAVNYVAAVGGPEHVPAILPLVYDASTAGPGARALVTLGATDRLLEACARGRASSSVGGSVVSGLPESIDRELADLLVELLDSRNSLLAGWAAKALAYSGAWDRQDDVARLLASPELHTRAGAIEALGILGAREYAGEIALSLRSPYPLVREAAAIALGRLEACESAEAIRRLLDEEEIDVRNAAAWALARIAPGEPVSQGLQAVGNDALCRLLWAPDRSAAWAALSELRRRQATECSTELGDLLDRSTMRLPAIWAIADLGVREQVGRIAAIAFAEDERPDVRQFAVHALGSLEAVEYGPRIVRLIESGDRRLATAAIGALGRVGGPEAEDRLDRLVDDPRWRIRVAAIDALVARRGREAAGLLEPRFHIDDRLTWGPLERVGELGAIQCAGALERIARSGRSRVRPRAVEALGWIGATDRRKRVESLLGDPEAPVRIAAARALGRFGDPAAAGALAARLSDPDGRLRAAVTEALAELGSPEALRSLADAYAPSRAAAVRSAGSLEPVLPLLDDPVASVRIEAVLAAGRLGARPESIERLERDPHRRVALAASIARVRLGAMSGAQERELLERVARLDLEERWAVELSVALAARSDAESLARASRPLRPGAPIESVADLERLFRDAGLELAAGELRWRGRVPAGTSISPREALARRVSGSARCLVFDGRRARALRGREALAVWRERLAAR